MLLWFVGTSIVTIWYVFRDPAFDYRLLIVGSVLPPVVDVWFGGARVMYSVTASVVLLAVVMLVTVGRRRLRRTLLGLPLGTFLHLVFSGAWADSDAFWWPFSGGFDEAPLPFEGRGWWNVVPELVGLALVVGIVRRAGLRGRGARRRFLRTGVLQLAAS
jgi:hypothetical protein